MGYVAESSCPSAEGQHVGLPCCYSPTALLLLSHCLAATLPLPLLLLSHCLAATLPLLLLLLSHFLPFTQSDAFSPDGKWLATGSAGINNNVVCLYNVTAPNNTITVMPRSRCWTAGAGAVTAVAFSLDSQTLITGGCAICTGV